MPPQLTINIDEDDDNSADDKIMIEIPADKSTSGKKKDDAVS